MFESVMFKRGKVTWTNCTDEGPRPLPSQSLYSFHGLHSSMSTHNLGAASVEPASEPQPTHPQATTGNTQPTAAATTPDAVPAPSAPPPAAPQVARGTELAPSQEPMKPPASPAVPRDDARPPPSAPEFPLIVMVQAQLRAICANLVVTFHMRLASRQQHSRGPPSSQSDVRRQHLHSTDRTHTRPALAEVIASGPSASSRRHAPEPPAGGGLPSFASPMLFSRRAPTVPVASVLTSEIAWRCPTLGCFRTSANWVPCLAVREEVAMERRMWLAEAIELTGGRRTGSLEPLSLTRGPASGQTARILPRRPSPNRRQPRPVKAKTESIEWSSGARGREPLSLEAPRQPHSDDTAPREAIPDKGQPRLRASGAPRRTHRSAYHKTYMQNLVVLLGTGDANVGASPPGSPTKPLVPAAQAAAAAGGQKDVKTPVPVPLAPAPPAAERKVVGASNRLYPGQASDIRSEKRKWELRLQQLSYGQTDRAAVTKTLAMADKLKSLFRRPVHVGEDADPTRGADGGDEPCSLD